MLKPTSLLKLLAMARSGTKKGLLGMLSFTTPKACAITWIRKENTVFCFVMWRTIWLEKQICTPNRQGTFQEFWACEVTTFLVVDCQRHSKNCAVLGTSSTTRSMAILSLQWLELTKFGHSIWTQIAVRDTREAELNEIRTRVRAGPPGPSLQAYVEVFLREITGFSLEIQRVQL